MPPRVGNLRRLLVLAPDWNKPAGGVRKLYRHVDVLCAHGLPASIVHQQPGFRCTWFENQTPVAYPAEIGSLGNGDLLLVPENLAWQMIKVAPGVPKVIFNQNAYQTFLNQAEMKTEPLAPYQHPDFVGTIVVSEDSRRYLSFAFPDHPVHRIRYSVEPTLFHDEPGKKKQIAFMPRKTGSDAIQIFAMLKARRSIQDFQPLPIDNKSESETAKLLRESMIFLSLSAQEGWGLPPMEAMACGCIVIGYHGRGGGEFLSDQHAFPIQPDDVIGFVQAIERIAGELRHNPEPLQRKARAAAEFIRHTYSPQREEQDIVEAWEQILGKSGFRNS